MTRTADLGGPLPTGTTVLEASAGTGKTYTIAGLVTRYVAEGVARLEEVLVVTFGRAATSELRTRVRERLRDVRDALRDGSPSDDAVVHHLREGDVGAAIARLSSALAGFDAATVATTHEFCLQVLHGLGTAADLDPGTVLVEDLRDLVVEVADDLYLRAYARDGAGPAHFGHEAALALARQVLRDPEAVLAPEDADPESPAARRVRFGHAVRQEVARRKRALGLLDFDDLLTRVRDALTDPVSGEVARQRLRARYRVVLVDEFQDTDPVQWDVLRLAFHGSRTLVVIGDPKQAIYAFRGADVNAYLAARAQADEEQTLGTNWRSDPALLADLADVLRDAALGHPEIRVRPVSAGHRGQVVAGGPPVRVRVLQREGLSRVASGEVQVGAARAAVASDVAVQVVELLQGAPLVTPRGGGEPRPLEARDVAVLVRKGDQAADVRDALLAAGVPVVLTGTSSVFATDAARDWQVLLEALEQPHRSGRVRRLALSSFVGSTATEVDAGGEQATDALALQVRHWGAVLAERGVAALFRALSVEQRLAARLLLRPDGERLVTDLGHVAEVLHAAATEGQLGLSGLLSWLRARVEDSAGDLDQERSRRLDTDASAVQVVTVHTSKGLEFPVVLLPFGWDSAGGGTRERYPRSHDAQGRRVLFVGGKDDPGYRAACTAQEQEDAGEELRLLYVALTRAVSRLVLWWAPTKNTARGPLHRLLFAPGLPEVPVERKVPDDAVVLRHLRSTGLPVELVDPDARAPRLVPPTRPDVPLAVAELARGLDGGWRRTSYTGLTRAVHDAPVGSEPEVAAKDDEADAEADAPGLLGGADAGTGADADAEADVDAALKGVPSPMADLPGGTAFGTLVHAVLEEADLSGDPLEGLRAACQEQLAHRTAGLTPEQLATALLPAVSTPLGPLAGGRALRDVPRRDLLPELDFELPLAGGDRPVEPEVHLGQVAGLLRHHLPQEDPVAPYADLLEAPALAAQPLRGYLGGSIDAVVRVDGRYLVLDHKTNRLAPHDEALTAWHYRRSALDAAVLAAHYPLQALLYDVALHRFLRWRLPGYRPEEHLGGVLYLFLRGMCGTDVDAGVWSWRPPAPLVVALSDLLAGSVPARSTGSTGSVR